MTVQSRPILTDGNSLAGIAALCVTMAILAGGVGGEIMRQLLSTGGALALIIAIGVLLTMSLVGISAIASLALQAVACVLDGAVALLDRGRPAR